MKKGNQGQGTGGSRDPGSAIPSRVPGPGSPGRAEGRLYVVATPIGTLSDLSPRARDVLAAADLIVAEDTRHVRKLLNHFGIATPARSLHEHNEARIVPALIAKLREGRVLALVSDAGTPLLCDPGYRLVRACRAEGIEIASVPGPSAVTAALSVAGLPPLPFTFAGFLPTAHAARRTALATLAALPHTLVLFLSPHRLAVELEACSEHLGAEREAALLAELSKLHERARRGSLAALASAARDGEARGEYTLVVGPPAAAPRLAVSRETAASALQEALDRGLPLGEARREAARGLGISRRELYDLLAGRRG